MDCSKTIHRWLKRPQNDSLLNKLMKNNSHLLRWDVPVPTGDTSLHSAGESTGNRHCLWTSSPEQCDTWAWPWHKSRACNWTAVVSLSSLICRSTSAFTATVIFVGRPEPVLLSMLFVSLCFCRNWCISIHLAIKPSSRNMPIRAKWRIRCLLYLLYVSCHLWKAETTNFSQSYPFIQRA